MASRVRQLSAKPPFFFQTLLNISKGCDTDETKFMIQVGRDAEEGGTPFKTGMVALSIFSRPLYFAEVRLSAVPCGQVI